MNVIEKLAIFVDGIEGERAQDAAQYADALRNNDHKSSAHQWPKFCW